MISSFCVSEPPTSTNLRHDRTPERHGARFPLRRESEHVVNSIKRTGEHSLYYDVELNRKDTGSFLPRVLSRPAASIAAFQLSDSDSNSGSEFLTLLALI